MLHVASARLAFKLTGRTAAISCSDYHQRFVKTALTLHCGYTEVLTEPVAELLPQSSSMLLQLMYLSTTQGETSLSGIINVSTATGQAYLELSEASSCSGILPVGAAKLDDPGRHSIEGGCHAVKKSGPCTSRGCQ